MIIVERIGAGSDLDRLVREINDAEWDEANELVLFRADDLAAFIARPDHVFVACHRVDDSGTTLAGIASGRVSIKPYRRTTWLLVDEVDVTVDSRRRGAGRAMMETLLVFARDSGCTEVWLATEPDNAAANALYESLGPTNRDEVIGYTWVLRTS